MADASLRDDAGKQTAGGASGERLALARLQDWPGRSPVRCGSNGAQDRNGQRDVGRLGAFAEHVEHLVARDVVQVGDLGVAGLR